MNLELKERALNINLRGEKILISFPTFGAFQDYSKKVDESKDGDLDIMVEFLIGLGMTIEQVRKCYPEDLKSIISILAGGEKK